MSYELRSNARVKILLSPPPFSFPPRDLLRPAHFIPGCQNSVRNYNATDWLVPVFTYIWMLSAVARSRVDAVKDSHFLVYKAKRVTVGQGWRDGRFLGGVLCAYNCQMDELSGGVDILLIFKLISNKSCSAMTRLELTLHPITCSEWYPFTFPHQLTLFYNLLQTFPQPVKRIFSLNRDWSHNSNDINMHIIQHYYDMLGSNSPSRRMLLTLNVKWEIWYLWVSTYPRPSLHPSRMHKHNVFIFIILYFL